MAIDILAAGATGTHTFKKVNVNTTENYVYFKDNNPPVALLDNTTWLYSTGIGSITGLTNNSLYYIKKSAANRFTFSLTSGGLNVDLTGAVSGPVKFNTPVVYSNILNIDSSTTTNQAVKYYTNSTPLTGLTSGNTYFLKNVSASSFAGSQALYTVASNTHTFTTCGQTGRVGPTQAQMRAAYVTTWDETYLSQGNFQGYQDWTVPVSGIYEFTASGASGNNGSGGGSVGRGAIVKGRVALTKGEIITIAVGQQGAASSTNPPWGGSGGGTFVVRKTGQEPLFVAGGGAGEPNVGAGRDGVLTQLGGRSTNNQVAGGLAGFGGLSVGGYSGGGGGFNSRGQNGQDLGGGSFLDGLTMGTNTRAGGYGGFGGGGQSDGTIIGQSGGGGGYSGGGGARSTSANHSGGGGGSYIAPTATSVGTSTGLFDGANTFNGAAITNLASYNTGEGSVVMTIVSTFTTGNEVFPHRVLGAFKI